MTNQALLTKQDIKDFINNAIAIYANNEILTRKQLAATLELSLGTVDKYIRLGMPWIGKPTRKQFNLNQCRKWIDEYKRNI